MFVMDCFVGGRGERSKEEEGKVVRPGLGDKGFETVGRGLRQGDAEQKANKDVSERVGGGRERRRGGGGRKKAVFHSTAAAAGGGGGIEVFLQKGMPEEEEEQG
jgi:hypothetical protein